MGVQVEERYDVVVVGGGAAGLSGALALGRARRSVLVVDAGEPRNAPAAAVHGYLGHEGVAPGELLARGREEVRGYGGEVVTGEVVGARRLDVPLDDPGGAFAVDLAGGRVVRARRLLVTTGLVDELPALPGVAERWGTDVLHCPYCHGWEVRDRPVAVLATGPFAVHQALLWRQWTADVTLLLHTTGAPAPEQAEQLAARGVAVVPGEVAALEVAPGDGAGPDGDRLAGVRLVAGRVVPCRALAGNVADPRAQVVTSAAAGLATGAAVNADLVAEDTARAVTAHRAHSARGARAHAAHQPAASPAEFWEERYRGRDQVWSGRANAVLVDVVGALPPGTALDLGSGEGGDAVWLARQGWQVTAVDISTPALERTAAHAASAGVGDGVTVEEQQHLAVPGSGAQMAGGRGPETTIVLPDHRDPGRDGRGGGRPGDGHLGQLTAAVPRWRGQRMTPGLRMPVGSKAVLMRRMRSSLAGSSMAAR